MMLSLQFPINPPTSINASFSSHQKRKKPITCFSFLSPQYYCIISTAQTKFGDGPNGFAHNYSYSSIMVTNPNSDPALSKFRLAAAGSKCVPKDDDDDDIQLPEGLEAELMPKHVAVIMDGNRRWARNRGLPVHLGYRAGGKAMKQLALNCSKFGVQVVSVFDFSTENWIRPKEEVDALMYVLEDVIRSDMKEPMQWRRLPQSLQKLTSSTEELAEANKGIRTHMVMALNYSGRYDIIEASKNVARKVRDGIFQVEDINEGLFEQHLETNRIEFPNPDLLIRTGGELRVSNFMLWQLAYTEMFFCNKMFPDFGEADLIEALIAFQQRQRRYGGNKY